VVLARAALPAVLIAALAAPAAAAPWRLALDGACIDAAAFRARAETQRVRPGDPGDVELRIATSRRAADRWHVVIELIEAGQPPVARELDGASCAAVTDAAILIVAVLLDGVVAAAPPPPDVVPTPTPTPAPVPADRVLSPAIDEPLRPRPVAEPVTATVVAALGVDAGALPGPTAGARAAVEVGWWRAVLAIGITGWMPVRETDAAGEGLEVWGWQAVGQARFRIARRIELGPQIEIGQLVASGVGVDTGLTNDGAWQAAGGVVRAELWSSGALEVVAAAELLVPLGRPRFVVDGEERFRPGVAVRGFVSIGWRLFDGSRGRRP
jgi:hypothetical protein